MRSISLLRKLKHIVYLHDIIVCGYLLFVVELSVDMIIILLLSLS